MTIEADRLTVQRLGRPVLHDVSLRIESGQCVSVIGPNGVGKSTLMAALLDLVPASGQVRIDGTAIRELTRRQIARRVAYVPQFHDGYLGFRVRDVVEAGRYAHLDPLQSLYADDRHIQAVDEAVAACRIGPLLERSVDTLSGGERQKVWIAAALAQQTPALFLDEPATGLDPAHQAELIRIMRRCLARGNTLLVICHDLNLAITLGGRVIALREGTVFFDEPAAVMEDVDRLGQLFGTKFALHRGADGALSIQLRVGADT